jgi:hypothetical protein
MAMSILNIGLAFMMATLGVLTIIEINKAGNLADLSEPFLASYMVMFALLLGIYEIMWWIPMPGLNKVRISLIFLFLWIFSPVTNLPFCVFHEDFEKEFWILVRIARKRLLFGFRCLSLLRSRSGCKHCSLELCNRWMLLGCRMFAHFCCLFQA